MVSEPCEQVTHLLLPVPSFGPDGSIVGGGNLGTLLSLLPKEITVIGGNLDRPELDYYATADLLRDESYLALNANITAHCALELALNQLPVILDGCKVLVIGWGRRWVNTLSTSNPAVSARKANSSSSSSASRTSRLSRNTETSTALSGPVFKISSFLSAICHLLHTTPTQGNNLAPPRGAILF